MSIKVNTTNQIVAALNSTKYGTGIGARAITCGSRDNYIVVDANDTLLKVVLSKESLSKALARNILTAEEAPAEDENRMYVLRSATALRVAQKVFNDMCSNYDMTLFPSFIIQFDKLLFKFRGNKEAPLEEPEDEDLDDKDLEDLEDDAEDGAEDFVEDLEEHVETKPKEGVGSEDVDTVKDVKNQVKEEINKKIEAPPATITYESADTLKPSSHNMSKSLASSILATLGK